MRGAPAVGMRTSIFVALPLLFTMACGGIVAEPTPSGDTGKPPSSSTASPPSTSTADTPPPPTTSVPPTTEPGFPEVMAGAISIEARGGSVSPEPGTSSKRSYKLSLATGTVDATYASGSAQVALGESERAEIDALLAAVVETPLPKNCSWDGPYSMLVVTRASGSQTYIPEDYNCRRDTSVSYAKGVGAVLAWFDQKVRVVGTN
jgi:hypothetical protein